MKRTIKMCLSEAIAAALSVSLMFVPSVQAANEQEVLDFFNEEAKVITVASSTPESVMNSVSNVTVIDRKMIEKYNFPTVADALRIVPGVMILRTFIIKHVVVMRGILEEHYNDKVLIMINNVPAFNPVTGEGDIDRVGIDAVERVEVLRGPGSVLYGSNAYTGAINIVLRKPGSKDKIGKITAGLGTTYNSSHEPGADLTRADGLYAWKGDKGDTYHLSFDMHDQFEPTYQFTDENKVSTNVRDYFKTKNFNFSGERSGHSLLLNFTLDNQSNLGVVPAVASGLGFDEAKEMELASYSYTLGEAGRQLKYTLTYDRQIRNMPRSPDDNTRTMIEGYRWVNNLDSHLDLGSHWDLELGGSHEYRKDKRYVNYTRTPDNEISQNNLRGWSLWEGSAFAQLEYDNQPFKGVMGTRYTFDDVSGSNLSSRGSAIYMIDDNNTIKAVIGQAFRTPSFFELYEVGTVIGNPNLSPEKDNSFELSYLTKHGNLFGQATLYYAEYIHNIYRALGNFTQFGVPFTNVNYYTNAGLITAKGLETELRYEGSRTNAYVNLNYIYGSNGDIHTITPNPGENINVSNFKFVPRYTLSEGIAKDIGDFLLTTHVNEYGSTQTLRTTLGANWDADASLAYKAGPFQHTLNVYDLTNRTILIPDWVRQRTIENTTLFSGRTWEYTVSYRF